MHVKVFSGQVPRQVRQVDSTSQEERLLVLLLQETGCALGCPPIRRFPGGLVNRTPVNEAGEDGIGESLLQPVTVTFTGRRTRSPHASAVLCIPGDGIGEFPVWLVIQLSPTPGQVAMLAEVLRQGHPLPVLRQIAEPVQVAIDPGGRWAQSRHDRRPGRTAQGGCAVGLLEKHSSFCKGINMRRPGLRMSAKTSHPVIQVIDRNEQDVRLLPGRRFQGQQPENQDGEHEPHHHEILE